MNPTKTAFSWFKKPLLNAASLSGWGLAGYGLSILAVPILTRFYEPGKFGTFALVWGASQIFGLAGTLRLEKAFFLAASSTEKAKIHALCYGCALLLGALLTSLVFATGGFSWLSEEMLMVLPVTSLCQSIILTEMAEGNSDDRYGRSGIAKGLQFAGVPAFAIAWAFLDFGGNGLVMGLVSSQILVAAMLLSNGSGGVFIVIEQRGVGLQKTFRKYINFVRYTMPHEVFGALSSHATAILIPVFFGNTLAGFFFLAQKCVMLPSTVLGSSLAQIYFHELGKCREERPERIRLFAYVLFPLSAISAILFSLIYIASPQIVTHLLGAQWSPATIFFSMITPWAALHFIGSVLSPTPLAMDKQGMALTIELINGILRFGFLSLGFLMNNSFLGIGFFIASGLIITGSRLIWYRRLIASDSYA
ncbi:MAG: oligosaccharide flippase family protein [Opitutales bacterium]